MYQLELRLFSFYRFPCLKMGIRTYLLTACDVVVATAVLHNLCLLWGEPEPVRNPDVESRNEMDFPVTQLPTRSAIAIRTAGQAKRDWIANHFCLND